MRLTSAGEQFYYRGNIFVVGEGVHAIASDFQGLYGIVKEIRDGEHLLVPDGPLEILCVFHPPVNRAVTEKIERRHIEINGKHRDIKGICEQEVIMNPSQLRPMKKCRIHQVQNRDRRFLFQPLEMVKKQGFDAPPGDAYRVVYDGLLPTDDLEEIYFLLNCRHPKGFKGWSLTTSDIVELFDDSGSTFYYCDYVGFAKIPFQSNTIED